MKVQGACYQMFQVTLAAFRRVRAGEKGMGGVRRQLSEIYGFFQELAGIDSR